MQSKIKNVNYEIGKLFLADEKKSLKKTKWGCTFSCSFDDPLWRIESPEFKFIEENTKTPEAKEKMSFKGGFLVKMIGDGNYELIKYLQGSKWSKCVVPENIKYVREGSFRGDQMEEIQFKCSEVVLEEGAFLYLNNLGRISFPYTCGRYSIKDVPCYPGAKYLFEDATGTILYFFTDKKNRRRTNEDIHLLDETRKIGYGAFSGADQLNDIWGSAIFECYEDDLYAPGHIPQFKGTGTRKIIRRAKQFINQF